MPLWNVSGQRPGACGLFFRRAAIVLARRCALFLSDLMLLRLCRSEPYHWWYYMSDAEIIAEKFSARGVYVSILGHENIHRIYDRKTMRYISPLDTHPTPTRRQSSIASRCCSSSTGSLSESDPGHQRLRPRRASVTSRSGLSRRSATCCTSSTPSGSATQLVASSTLPSG